ncbi:hypothetical protein IW261DRAFT_889632 [Armillaria novae-zelandiae]|uniref:Uncharacterized protein n=1 Tax=Armillaria novae-zelandiae TaxID=153914 RepID=A0AA39UMT4_9AGAR|nr:hypothetical protein IW261DRAFT_889632 [Armillaria novae-zelandiae]
MHEGACRQPAHPNTRVYCKLNETLSATQSVSRLLASTKSSITLPTGPALSSGLEIFSSKKRFASTLQQLGNLSPIALLTGLPACRAACREPLRIVRKLRGNQDVALLNGLWCFLFYFTLFPAASLPTPHSLVLWTVTGPPLAKTVYLWMATTPSPILSIQLVCSPCENFSRSEYSGSTIPRPHIKHSYSNFRQRIQRPQPRTILLFQLCQ